MAQGLSKRERTEHLDLSVLQWHQYSALQEGETCNASLSECHQIGDLVHSLEERFVKHYQKLRTFSVLP